MFWALPFDSENELVVYRSSIADSILAASSAAVTACLASSAPNASLSPQLQKEKT